MVDSTKHPLELLLELCARAAPEPWYPSLYVKETGADREKLDPYLDQLRMSGLIRLTDWVQGRGQGYALTPAGQEVVQSPRLMNRLLAGKFVAAEPEEKKSSASSPFDRGEAVRAPFLYPSVPVVTYILVSVNIAVFACENLSPQDFPWLGVNGLEILRGQWWRLISTCFVHANIVHIACNMYALFNLGRFLEQMWGRWRYLTIYLIAGLAGSCAGLMANPGGVVGASAAICGIFAAEAAWMYLNRSFLPPPFLRAWRQNFVINLVLLTFISFLPGVSGAGHLGGAIAGFIVAVLLYFLQYETGIRRVVAAIGVLAVPVLSVLLLQRTINSSPKWKELVRWEKKQLDLRENNERSQSGGVTLRGLQEVDLPLSGFKLRVLSPKDWNPAKVPKNSQALAEAKRVLNNFLLSFQEAGPYEDEQREEIRQLLMKKVEADIKFLQMEEDRLEQGEKWTPQQQRSLEQQFDRVQELQKQLTALIDQSLIKNADSSGGSINP